MFEHWEIGAFGLMGAAFIVVGVIARGGRYHAGIERTYLRRDLPKYQRNAVFALLPIGVAFVCLSAGAGLMQAHGTLATGRDVDPLTNGLMILGIAALITGVWWTLRPPGWAKPGWIREYDRQSQHSVTS
ncbi:MAG TPA: hypothetical protein VGJ60_36620 [Chloroflexota bacterium]|jgi:hypothetical protein